MKDKPTDSGTIEARSISEAAAAAFMSEALKLASLGSLSTRPNPAVGCVLVQDGKIVGRGWHERAGEPHAEIRALAEAGELAKGADCYVTLEPCAHHGRTGPCALALIEAGVASVSIATRDPNPRVAGRGIDMLREAKIAVSTGICSQAAVRLNRSFLHRMRTGKPFVRLKIAASLDGRTAMASGESQWITGAAARADVQNMRASAGAILTGIGTVLADDPRLTVRGELAEAIPAQPLRVVLDSHHSFPGNARMLAEAGDTLVCTASALPEAEISDAGDYELLSCPADAGRVDIEAALRALAAREVNEVLVEAGATLSGALLDKALVDECIVYLAPVLLGAEARALVELPGLEALADARRFEIQDTRQIGQDLRLLLRPLPV